MLVKTLSGKTEEENADVKLTSTIKRAQDVIASLNAGEKHTSLANTTHGASSRSFIFTKASSNTPHHSHRVEKTIEQDYPKFFKFRETEQEDIDRVEKSLSFSESKAAPMSVTDLVQKQKEEFWASLVERGYLKPKLIPKGEDQERETILQMASSSAKATENKKDARIQRKSEENRNLVSGTAIMKENKETQVSSSFPPSNVPPLFSQMEESEVSPVSSADVHVKTSFENSSDVGSLSRKASKSDINKSKSGVSSVASAAEQSPTDSSTSVCDGQSESFPSYDGTSKS